MSFGPDHKLLLLCFIFNKIQFLFSVLHRACPTPVEKKPALPYWHHTLFHLGSSVRPCHHRSLITLYLSRSRKDLEPIPAVTGPRCHPEEVSSSTLGQIKRQTNIHTQTLQTLQHRVEIIHTHIHTWSMKSEQLT